MIDFFGSSATPSDVATIAGKAVDLASRLRRRIEEWDRNDEPFDRNHARQCKSELDELLLCLDTLRPLANGQTRYATVKEWLEKSRTYVVEMLQSIESWPDSREWLINCNTIAVNGFEAIKPFCTVKPGPSPASPSTYSVARAPKMDDGSPMRFGEFVAQWKLYEQLKEISKDEFRRAGNVVSKDSPMFPLWMQAQRTRQEYVNRSCELRNDPGYSEIRALCLRLWGEEVSHTRLLQILGMACERMAKVNNASGGYVIGAIEQAVLAHVAEIFEDPPAPDVSEDRSTALKEGPWFLCDPKDSPDAKHAKYVHGPVTGCLKHLTVWMNVAMNAGPEKTIRENNGRSTYYVRKIHGRRYEVWFDRSGLYESVMEAQRENPKATRRVSKRPKRK